MFPLLGNLEYDTTPNPVPYTIKLTNKTWAIANGEAFLGVSNLGNIYTIGDAGITSWIDQWVNAQGFTGFGDSFEVKLTKSGGDDPGTNPGLSSWITIDTEVIWGWLSSASFTGTLAIQPRGGNGTSDILASAAINVVVSFPFSFDNASQLNSFSTTATINSAGNISVSLDGTTIWCFDLNDKKINEYTMSTPFDLSTAAYVGEELRNVAVTMDGLKASEDGSKVYYIGSHNEISEFAVGTAWDISTLALTETSGFDYSAQTTTAAGFCMNSTGTKLYLLDVVSSIIYQYSMSVAWDVSTCTYDSITYDASAVGYIYDIALANSDTELLMLTSTGGAGGETLHYGTLGTASDISSCGSISTKVLDMGVGGKFRGVWVNALGTLMYTHNGSTSTSDAIREWSIT